LMSVSSDGMSSSPTFMHVYIFTHSHTATQTQSQTQYINIHINCHTYIGDNLSCLLLYYIGE
jgi:hypothetical protein